MENRAGEAGRPDAASTRIYEDSPQLDASELVSLRERIAFYEGFHRVIQDNVARSADLMRQAADRHAEAEKLRNDAAAERLQVQQARLEALDGLQHELQHFQTVLNALTARVATSISVLTADGVLSAPIRWPSLDWATRSPVIEGGLGESTGNPQGLGFVAAPESAPALRPESTAVDDPHAVPAGEDRVSETPVSAVFAFRDGTTANGSLILDVAGNASAIGSLARDEATLPGDRARSIAALLEPAPAAALEASSVVNTTCVIHGVPGVHEARSFEHHLNRLPGLGTVAIREFHLGVLRLEVSGSRPARAADLNSIPGFSNLEEVDAATGVVIVRFPGAPL